MEVSPEDPLCTFGRMAPSCPSPEKVPDVMVDCCEARFGHHVAVVRGPAPDDRVEQPDYRRLCGACMLLDDFPSLAEKRFHALLRRLDQQFLVVLAYVLTQEVEALLNVSDPGLLSLESSRPLSAMNAWIAGNTLACGTSLEIPVTTKSSAYLMTLSWVFVRENFVEPTLA